MNPAHHRILVIDDNPAIHDDVRKILATNREQPGLAELEAAVFSEAPRSRSELQLREFEIDSAFQGADGVCRVEEARQQGRPYSVAFVDMRMPPGIDGLETIERIWRVDADIQVVMCTAYSDSRWQDVASRLGVTDKLLILKKPFDAAEVCQTVWSLAEKWRLSEEGRRQREELARSLAMARAIQDAVLDGILVVDENRRMVDCNQRFSEIWAIPPHLLAERDDEQMIRHVVGNLAEPQQFIARVEHLYRNPSEVSTDLVLLKDGRTLERRSGPVWGDKRVLGRIWSFRDVTERKKIESERALLTERMASIGRLAAGVGHEINNPLTFVLANVEQLAQALRTPGSTTSEGWRELAELGDEALAGLSRIRVIVRDLQTLTRSDDETMGPVRLHEILDRAIAIATNELRHRAKVVRDYSAVPDVQGNDSRLGQVFLNLLMNAAQAIPEGHAENNEIRVRCQLDGSDVVVEVSDSGTGIPPDALPRIFDPFFTTKAVGAGTGLGLSIVKRIVDQHHASISVTSQPDVGTTFTVRLPRAQAPRAPVVEAAPTTRAASGKVLVIEDDSLVAAALKRMLADHHVVCVGRGRDAIERLKLGEHYDIILCDVMMPDVTGLDVHAELMRVSPELAQRMVFMTGGTFTEKATHYLAQVSNLRLEKPFGRVQVRSVVERMMHAALEVAQGSSGLPN